MNKLKLKHIINTAIIAWTAIWLYYLIFNWEVFSIKLNTNLGFAVIGSYPFLLFSILGIILLILIKYFEQTMALRELRKKIDLENSIALLEKDIENFKLKETLLKMQAEEINSNSSNLKTMYNKLDDISNKIEKGNKSEDGSSDKKNDIGKD